MPGLNGTGPFGQGAMTGGRRGYCANSMNNNSFQAPRGYGQGFGLGRGFKNRRAPNMARFGFSSDAPNPDLSVGTELELLKNQAEFLQNELNAIQTRVQTLQNEKKND